MALSSVVTWLVIFVRSAFTSAVVERLDKLRPELEAKRAARTINCKVVRTILSGKGRKFLRCVGTSNRVVRDRHVARFIIPDCNTIGLFRMLNVSEVHMRAGKSSGIW
jgi:hypothetical protein